MKIRFTPRAIKCLEAIQAFVAKDSPVLASKVVAEIAQNILRLEDFPHIGRAGRIPGTRELVMADLPYIVPYRVEEDRVIVLSIIHTRRKWPEKL